MKARDELFLRVDVTSWRLRYHCLSRLRCSFCLFHNFFSLSLFDHFAGCMRRPLVPICRHHNTQTHQHTRHKSDMAKPIMVIGTSSPRRREIAQEHFGRDYELVCLSPDIDEKQFRSTDPFALTSLIAHGKMEALRAKVASEADVAELIAQRPGSVAVTFDQVVYYHNEIREKPESKEEAVAFIESYSNDQLGTVMTTVLYSFTRDMLLSMPNTTLTFYREIPADVIARVVERGVCFSTAGGFVVEDVEMKECLIKIEPGTEEEVRGFSEKSVRALLADMAAS